MGTNDRFRKHAAKVIDSDESILAATNTVRNGSGHMVRPGQASRSVAGGPDKIRDVLGLVGDEVFAGEMTIITDRRVLFCDPDQWSLRPKPKTVTFEAPLADVRLTWGEVHGASTWRVLCFHLPDDRFIIREAVRGSKVASAPDDEAELIVQAFGARSTQVDLD